MIAVYMFKENTELQQQIILFFSQFSEGKQANFYEKIYIIPPTELRPDLNN